MTLERKQLGAAGEAHAARMLRRAGLRIIARNYACPRGELDIVARKRNLIIFVEVKTRATAAHADPREAVTPAKQRRMAAAAHQFLREKKLEKCDYRFDIVSVILGGGPKPELIEHHENAFTEYR
jgi:putative endonuclease